MNLPKINKEDLPEEMQERLGDAELEIDSLVDSISEEEIEELNSKARESNAVADRKLLKKMDQLQHLQSLYNNNNSKKENWKKIKKASRYFRSSLYEIKTLDR
jgi:TRAP-type mannitol/chloroaromatic compound transport system substrate-binding protein